MNRSSFLLPLLAIFVLAAALAQVTRDVPSGKPYAVVDLATPEGVALVMGEWRYSDAQIVEVDHRAPGAGGKPSGPPNRTHDIEPHAGPADFDDSSWLVVDPKQLHARRSTGRLCFGWYRLHLTIPETVGSLSTAGTTAVFEIVVDDYAEVWVNGKLPVVLGQSGGPMIAGFNSPNRVVIGRDLHPGQKVQIAVFAANGPMSNPPPNYLWVRSAALKFYQ